MRQTFGLLVVLASAVALGVGTAWLAVRSPVPLDTLTIGPWQAWPLAGAPEDDPYSKARLARTGEIPLGSGEGLALFARTDNAGNPMRGACDYSVAGQVPPARLWTMTIEASGGAALAAGEAVHAIGSDAVVRRPDGTFEVRISPRPRAGNWLSSADVGRFRLVIRLYDTTTRTTTGISGIDMPEIRRERCA